MDYTTVTDSLLTIHVDNIYRKDDVVSTAISNSALLLGAEVVAVDKPFSLLVMKKDKNCQLSSAI